MIRLYLSAECMLSRSNKFYITLSRMAVMWSDVNRQASTTDLSLALILTGSMHDLQESSAQVGPVSPPIEGTSPSSVPGQTELTQALYGALDNGTYLTRGYDTSVPNLNMPNTDNSTQVAVGSPNGALDASASTATAGK